MSDVVARYLSKDELVELLADWAHQGWMVAKQADGIASRLSEWGEEFMVPYAELSERAKDIDRAAVRSVIDGLETLGVPVDKLVRVGAPDLPGAVDVSGTPGTPGTPG